MRRWCLGMLKDFLLSWRCFSSPCHKWQFFLWSQREIVKPQQWKKKDTVYLYTCMKATPWHRLSQGARSQLDKAEPWPSADRDKVMSGLLPVFPTTPSINCLESKCLSCFSLMTWLEIPRAATARAGSRQPSENTGKGERGGTGDKTQPSTQDAHAGGCGRVFSVVFLWPLVPLNSCYGRKHHKAP